MLLEDRAGRVLLRALPGGGWGLPGCAIPADAGGGYMDNANVIGPLTAGLESEFGGPPLAWLSWIADRCTATGDSSSMVRRIYGHRLDEPGCITPPWAGSSSKRFHWCDFSELRRLAEAGQLECAGLELAWAKMWQLEQDEAGESVRRGFGVGNHTHFGYTHFDNVPAGVYHVGRFVDGSVLPPAPKIKKPTSPRCGATVERLPVGKL